MEPVSAAEAQEGEVVVRHCTVRVVRHGGWSWGPAPERLPQRVVDLLPELLAQRFAAELAGEVDVEITESVTLVVPMSLARLTCATAPAAAAAPLAGKPPEPVPVPVLSGAAGPAPRLPPRPSPPRRAPAGRPGRGRGARARWGSVRHCRSCSPRRWPGSAYWTRSGRYWPGRGWPGTARCSPPHWRTRRSVRLSGAGCGPPWTGRTRPRPPAWTGTYPTTRWPPSPAGPAPCCRCWTGCSDWRCAGDTNRAPRCC